MGRCPWSRDEYSLSKRGLPSPKIVMQHVCTPLQQVHSSFIFLPHIGHTVEIKWVLVDKEWAKSPLPQTLSHPLRTATASVQLLGTCACSTTHTSNLGVLSRYTSANKAGKYIHTPQGSCIGDFTSLLKRAEWISHLIVGVLVMPSNTHQKIRTV